jgi:hypothetical protein
LYIPTIDEIFRIMVDRGLTITEAKTRPEVMDLCPDGATFEEKFQINELDSNAGSVSKEIF